MIWAFARTAVTPKDALKLSVIGYARGHALSAPDRLSKILRHRFTSVTARAKPFGGLSFVIDPSNLSQLVILDEILIQRVYDLALLPFKPDLILDCGAHIGLFTLQAAGQFPTTQITAFEPHPENCQWLRRQTEQNDLSVDILEAAVSTRTGESWFSAAGGCGGVLKDSVSDSATDSIRVKTVDLADYILKRSPDRLLIKMDIEGAEEELLPRIMDVFPQDTFLFIETHGGKQSWDRLHALLLERGFDANATRERGIYIDGLAVRCSSNASAVR